MAKLLHISGNTYPSLDEKEHHTKRIWKELAKGFDEYHILARSEDNRYRYSKEDNIHLHLVPRLMKKSKIFFFSSFWMFYLIRKYEITHLLAQCPIVGGFTAAMASKWYKITLMVEIHGDVYFKFMKEKNFKDKIFSKIVKFTFENAKKIRSLSSAMNLMLIDAGVDGEKIKIIPNRVNTDLFQSKKDNYELHDPIRIISIGRFVEQKGYDIAIKAIRTLSQHHNIELYLIGGGPLFKKYEDLAKNHRSIKLVNWIAQNELKELLEQSDIYIQPSKPFYGEAMPRAILEAMAMKLPVITTNIAAIPGIIINRENGILIDANSEEQLVEAIDKMIDDIGLRERVALQGYQDILEKYEWNKVFELYRREILTMVNKL